MKPQFRFTLFNATVGTQVISEPAGWDKIEFNLERHPDYRSLIEHFEVPLIFYGSDGIHDGGYSFILQALAISVNEIVEILVEIKPNDSDPYETLFNGILKLSENLDSESEKEIQIPVIRNDLWSVFIARRDMPINLKDTVDVDQNAITQRNEMTLQLPCQKITQTYSAVLSDPVNYNLVSGLLYGVIDFDLESLNEIAEKYNYPRVYSTTRPFEFFAMKYAGDYTFDCNIFTTDGAVNPTTNLDVYFQINDDTPIAFTKTDLGTPTVDGRTLFEYNDTHSLNKGDHIRIYFQGSAAPANTFEWTSSYPSYLIVTGKTSLPDSSTPAFLVFDAALSIIEKLLGRVNTFYSEYFGGQGTAIPYGSDGCGYPHVITKGLHVRGWSLADKPFQMSFQDWWDGCHNIFGLGLGYEELDSSPGHEVIVVEKLESFYDDSSNSVTLTNVMDIEFGFDESLVHTSVPIGYSKWEAEAESGIDDPQTKHIYNSKLKLVGRGEGAAFSLLSKFYAASLGIEQTRRQSEEKNKDWKLDEDIMIIHADLSATPEQPALFDASFFTNLNTPETRYNVKLTPYVNFQRWLYYLGITGAETANGGYTFAKGEGNVTMTFDSSSSSPTGCEAEVQTWTENQNITGTLPSIHRAKTAKFSHQLTYVQYKAIIASRKKSIAVRYYDSAGVNQEAVCFIKKMKYKINESEASFELWVKTIAPV